MRRILISTVLGALAGAFLSALAFFAAALADGTGLAETLGYSLVVAVVGAFLGGIVGAAVGIGKQGMFGGALIGLLVALSIVALYVLGFGRAGEYSHFLSESRVIIAGLTVPLILTGMAAAMLNSRLENR